MLHTWEQTSSRVFPLTCALYLCSCAFRSSFSCSAWCFFSFSVSSCLLKVPTSSRSSSFSISASCLKSANSWSLFSREKKQSKMRETNQLLQMANKLLELGEICDQLENIQIHPITVLMLSSFSSRNHWGFRWLSGTRVIIVTNSQYDFVNRLQQQYMTWMCTKDRQLPLTRSCVGTLSGSCWSVRQWTTGFIVSESTSSRNNQAAQRRHH